MHQLRSNPDVTRHFETIKSENVLETQTWLNETIQHNSITPRLSYNLAILNRTKLNVIGWIGIGNKEDGLPGDLDFGYALLPDYWGLGYATEALTAIIYFVFTKSDASRIFGECDAKNVASARVMEKAGMKRIRPEPFDKNCEKTFLITKAMWNLQYLRENGKK